jgi:NADH-quinone oxidoreductase subunit F
VGRGGAGFPTGMKWGFIPQPKEGEVPKPHYLVVNADESEPGTCKDIPLMMASPHTLVEGVIVSSYAIRANVAFIYVRGEVLHVVRRLQRAVQEAYLAGHLGKDIHGSGFDLDLIVHAGAGAYICGEETALLDSLEGRRGQPRLRPPFPAVAGLYASPTVINNVESIASVPCIITGGASWFSSWDREVQGHDAVLAVGSRAPPRAVRGTARHHPAPAARPQRRHRGGREAKFWTPGGSSTPILTDQHLDVPLDYEGVTSAGSMLGTKALQIFDQTTSVSAACCDGPSSTSTSPAQVHAVPRGHVVAGADPAPLEAGQGARATSSCCSTSATTSSAGPSARSATVPPPDHLVDRVLPRRVRRPLHRGGCPFDPAASTGPSGGPHDHDQRHRPGAVEKTDLVHVTIDGVEVSRPQGHLVIRAAEQIGVADPAVLRPPAARAGRRLPPVPGRDPRRRQRPPDPQAAGVVHAPGRRRAWWSRPRSPHRSPTRRSRASSSSC